MFRTKVNLLAIVISIISLVNLPLSAGVGTTGGTTLLQPIGGRAAGLGEAYTTAENDVFAVHYNPACRIDQKIVSVLYQRGFVEDNFGVLGLSLPFSFGRLASTLVYYSAGPVEMIDTAGQTQTVNGLTDLLWTASYGRELGPDFSVGGNLKVLSSTLIEEFKSVGYMCDLGCIYRITGRAKTGLAAQNLGGKLKYSQETENVPLVIRAGGSYELVTGTNKLITGLDVVKMGEDERLKEQIGAEYNFRGLLAFRLGYKLGYDSDNVTFGFGFNAEQFSIDYSLAPYGDLGLIHQISYSMKFGGPARQKSGQIESQPKKEIIVEPPLVPPAEKQEVTPKTKSLAPSKGKSAASTKGKNPAPAKDKSPAPAEDKSSFPAEEKFPDSTGENPTNP